MGVTWEMNPAQSPEPTLRHALRHVNRAFQAHLRGRLAEYGVSEAEYMALFALRRFPDMSGADLSRWTGVTAQGANQVLKGLITAGLVQRRPAAGHGRILLARLTGRGEEVVAACERAADAVEDAMCADLSRAEVALLESMLRRCADGLGVPIRGDHARARRGSADRVPADPRITRR